MMRSTLLMVVLVAACTTDESMPPDGSVGVDAGADAPTSYAPCPTCCDPVNQTGCGSTEGCYGTRALEDVVCRPAGEQKYAEACDVDNGSAAMTCEPGLWCGNFQGGGQGLCGHFCVVDEAPPSPCTHECLPTYTKYGLATYGVCFN